MTVSFSKNIAERVLTSTGLSRRASVADLVKETQKFDVKNKGYLSQDEFVQGAALLAAKLDGASTTANVGSYRFSRETARSVDEAFLRGNPSIRFTQEQLIEATAEHDDGNRYLNRKELEAGAIDLQRRPARVP